MFLISVLLSAITLNPALQPPGTATQGYVRANVISPDLTCKPGAICATGKLPVNRNGCFVDNYYNGSVGGTPLTINVTETGPNGSTVYLYWVNATSTTISIKSSAYGKYYCPPS
ncbi:MAG TPA: hypothetical protein VFF63_08800 [Candidatus Babeliales bacterium]|nr:hypothetical protein [Candidatus Babeliales bacterium]